MDPREDAQNTSPGADPLSQLREGENGVLAPRYVLSRMANVLEDIADVLHKNVDREDGPDPKALAELHGTLGRLDLILQIEVQRLEGVNLTTMPKIRDE